jgi:molybdate transport system substrate-binding protein
VRRPRPRRSIATAVALAAGVLVTGCGDGGSARHGSSSTSPDRHLDGSITVFAAASLTEAFGDLGTRFEHDHPGTTVTFDFGASSSLAAQIAQGAPADVLASADEATMDRLAASSLVGHPAAFAHNRLAILVADGNPHRIASLADLADPALTVVLCARQVPCGRYAARVLATAGVAVSPRSLETDVKGVVTKVETGDADAGVVYATDARSAADDTDSVAIPTSLNAIATYPIAVTAASTNRTLARAFVEYVRSPAGQRVLHRSGFTRP